jgi:hypothetical protein
MKPSSKAQALLEYVAIAVLIMSGILISGPYAVRSINAFFKSADSQTKDAMNERISQGPSVANMPPCVPVCQGKECGSDGCGGTCLPGCGAGEVCRNYKCISCIGDCTGKQCGDNGCGGSCGNCCPACTPPTSCVNNRCSACTPDCILKKCGPDGCGNVCGHCSYPDDDCVAGHCTCVPIDCVAQGKNCGTDGCDPVGCGTCAVAGDVCVNGVCCTPAAYPTCGDDGCGGWIDCPAPEVCNPNDHQCCSPTCGPMDCGDNGCGGTCPDNCSSLPGGDWFCNGGTCCNPSCDIVDFCGPSGCGAFNCPCDDHPGWVCGPGNVCCDANCPFECGVNNGCGAPCVCTPPEICRGNSCCDPTCYQECNSTNACGDACTCSPPEICMGNSCCDPTCYTACTNNACGSFCPCPSGFHCGTVAPYIDVCTPD